MLRGPLTWLLVVAAVIAPGATVLAVASAIDPSGGEKVKTWPADKPVRVLVRAQGPWPDAIASAAAGWNRIGAGPGFRVVETGGYDVVVRATRDVRRACDAPKAAACVSHLGRRSTPTTMWVPARVAEGRDWARQIATHELGHVLGLRHRPGGCEVMRHVPPDLSRCAPVGREVDAAWPPDCRYADERQRRWRCAGMVAVLEPCGPMPGDVRQLAELYGTRADAGAGLCRTWRGRMPGWVVRSQAQGTVRALLAPWLRGDGGEQPDLEERCELARGVAAGAPGTFSEVDRVCGPARRP